MNQDIQEQFMDWRFERLAERLSPNHDFEHNCDSDYIDPRGTVGCGCCWQALLDEIDCNPRIKS